MKKYLLLTICSLMLMACASKAPVIEQDFDKFAETWWQQVLAVQPKTNSGLPDMSVAAVESAHNKRLALMAQLEEIDYGQLNEQQQINYIVLHFRLKDAIDQFNFGMHYMPLNSETSFHSDAVRLLNVSAKKSDAEILEYLDKLADLPAYMQQQMAWMKQGLAKGYTQPKEVLTDYDKLIRPFITADPTKSIFYRPFQTNPGFSNEQWLQLQQQAMQLIAGQIIPAYQQYLDFFITEYRPGARDSIAAKDLPDGAAFYQNRVEHFTTLPLTPQQVHDIGLQEVARIRKEMEQVIAETGFSGSFAEFIQFLRTDKQFYAATPDELMREAAYLSKKIDAKLPLLFNMLPRTPYGVAPVPAEIAPRYTSGRYSEGRALGDAGFYWVNTYALNRRPLYEMEALTLHEAVPGHHLQISLAKEQASLPSYRRDFYNSAFGEGWALYAEYLGLEVGFYQDPYSNFGRLTYEMWRACRLVVDTGMHTMGWSRQQAIDFLAENTALSMHNIQTETDRYITWPAQAVSYKIGEITIKRLRRQVEDALADKFDVREFHNVILENGSVTLPVLEQQIQLYIKRKQQS